MTRLLTALRAETIAGHDRDLTRIVIFGGACIAAAIAASGVVAPAVFKQPSLAKYVITVAGPAIVAMLALTRSPLRMLVGLGILVAPVAFVATLNGLQVTPLVCVLLMATLLAAGRRRFEPMGWIGYGSVAAAVLLVPAIASAGTAGSYAVWLGETLLMGWLVYVVASEPEGIRFVLVMIVASVAVQGLLAVYEYRTGHQINLYSGSGVATLGSNYFFSYGSAKRYTGTMPDPIALGNVLALGLPLMICVYALDRRLWVRVLVAGAGASTALALILSLSRMSWIGGAAGSAACLMLLPRRVRFFTCLGVTGVAALVAAVGLGLGGAALRKRVTSTLNPTNVQSSYATTARGDQLRIRLWVAAIRTAESEPLTGTGFGNLAPALNSHGVAVPPAAHAQSWYFQVLGEAGLLGAAALLCWIVAAIHDLWVAFGRFRIVAAGATGSLLAALATWATDIEPRYLPVSAMVASLFGLIAALGGRRPPGGGNLG